MGRRKTPQEKKALSYARDHIVDAECPHGTRKTWPRKKKRRKRAARRTGRRAIERMLALDPVWEDEPCPKRPRLRKWGVMPLRELIEVRRERRARRAGYNRVHKLGDGAERDAAFDALIADTDTPSAGELRALAQRLGRAWFWSVWEARGWVVAQWPIDGWVAWERDRLRRFVADDAAREARLTAWLAHHGVREDAPPVEAGEGDPT